MSELGGLAFPTKTVRENRVEVPKNFPGSIVSEKCDLFVAAAQNGLLDRPLLLRLPPPSSGMGPAKQLYQIRRITYPAARFFTAAK